MLLSLLLLILSLIYAALLVRYGIAFRKIKNFSIDSTVGAPANFFSVIIPARNEEANIGACLDAILAQTLQPGCFEIIVIDDHSTDATASIVFSRINENVRMIKLSDHVAVEINSYKKKAIEIGVAAARGKYIVTTDADCIAPKKWLETLAAFCLQENPSFIAMPVRIKPVNNFVALFQSLDFMMLQAVTAAGTGSQKLSMCNGANLAFEKLSFENVGGFKNIDNIASGDDMLLMHKIHQRSPGRVKYLMSTDVIVNTSPVNSVRDFFNQRIRWASKSRSYNDKRILPVLSLVYIINLLLLFIPLNFLFYSLWNMPEKQLHIGIPLFPMHFWCAAIFLKFLGELFLLWPAARFYKRSAHLPWLFILQPLHILYTIIAGGLGAVGTYEWKGRKVK